MISKLYNFWQILKGNFWFVPAAFCFLSIFFISSLYYLEVRYFKELDLGSYVFQGTTDDAKSVTITLLSAMITMATLAISITIVVLSLAASQLGPRLIKTFMADRKTKDFIGLFFATVMACFVLTVILHSRTSEAITPQITISAVLGLCLVNLFVLLGFVHHVAQSCIADNVVRNVSYDLHDALRRLTRDSEKQNLDKKPEKSNWPKDFDTMSRRIFFERSGYVQHIDYAHLMELALDYNLRLNVSFKAGQFLVQGQDGVRIYSKIGLDENIEKAVKNSFIIGESRTPTQDLEYSVRHLVEIAIRALSPGINDSFTAVSVLDHLSQSLSILFQKETMSEEFFDEDGIQRMHAVQSDDADIIFTAFDQIRFNSSHMPSMVRHMLQTFIVLEELTKDKNSRLALLKQVEAIKHDVKISARFIVDETDLHAKIDDLIKKLKS